MNTRIKVILPNLVTSFNIILGFIAIILCADPHGGFHEIRIACWLIIFATIIDMMDGKIARLVGTSSQFGIEYDSLADVVTFGVGTGVIFYRRFIAELGANQSVLVIIPLMFVLCGSLRLARFNTGASTGPKTDYKGLPIPVASGIVASSILFLMYIKNPKFLGISLNFSVPVLKDPQLIVVACAGILVLSVLMLSNVTYPHSNKFFFYNLTWFKKCILVVLFFALTLIPSVGWFVMGITYLLKGLIDGTMEVISQYQNNPVDSATPSEEQNAPHG